MENGKRLPAERHSTISARLPTPALGEASGTSGSSGNCPRQRRWFAGHKARFFTASRAHTFAMSSGVPILRPWGVKPPPPSVFGVLHLLDVCPSTVVSYSSRG